VIDPPEDLSMLLESLKRNRSAVFILQLLAQKGCGHGKRVFAGKDKEGSQARTYSCITKDADAENPKALMYQALAHLGQGKKAVPLGISYSADFLRRETFSGGAKPSEADHSSILIGSRPSKDGKGCQVLLRNSWGTSCESYTAAHKANCKDGQVWIDAEALFQPGVTFSIERISEGRT
jgi:hypothetical protein